MKKQMLWLALAVTALFAACGGEEKTADGYTITAGGMQIKTLKSASNGDTVTPNPGDELYIWLAYMNSRDSVILNESGLRKQAIKIPMLKSLFRGDVFDAITNMHRGDSIVARVSVDSIKKYLYQGYANLLMRLDSTEKFLGFSMRLDSIIDSTVVVARKAQRQQKRLEEQQVMMKAYPIMDSIRKAAVAKQTSIAAKDKALLPKFLKDHNITVAADPDGIYYVETKKGTGKKVEAGMVLSIHYMGRFLDGTLFDGTQVQSWMLPATFGYKIDGLYPGFEKALSQMNIGSKCTVVMPGDQGNHDGVYRAFDIEIVKEVTGDDREEYINSRYQY